MHSTIAFADRMARALISMQLKDYEAVRGDASALLEQSPGNPVANYLQGMLDFYDKRYSKATMRLDVARPVARQFPSLLYFLSAGHLIDRNIPLAEKFGGEYVALQPDDGRGRKLLASILILQNRFNYAQDMLQPVLDQYPDDVQALNFMANALLLDDQGDMAMALYARIAKLQPTWRIVPLRQEAGLTKSSDTVNGEAQSDLDSLSNFSQLEILKILNLLEKKDFDGAIEVAKHYRYGDSENLAPYAVLGKVYLAAGRPADAQKIYEQALERKPRSPFAMLGLAQIALAAGDMATARQYYDTLLDSDDNNLMALLQLNAIEAREKDVMAMISVLVKTIQLHPLALEPRLRLAGYYLGSGKPKKVAPLFADLGVMQRRSPHVLEMTAQAQTALKQTDSALATYQHLVDVHPGYARSHYLLAMAAGRTGDQQKYKSELIEAITRDPKHVLSLIKLARLAKDNNEQTQFQQYVATLEKLAPDVPEVLRFRAMSAMESGDSATALALAERAFEKAPSNQTLLELIIFQNAAGKKVAARRTLHKWITNHPADIAARLLLAHSLKLANDGAGAQAQYYEVLKLAPGNLTALNNLAWDLRLKNPAKALELIRRATTIAPDSPVLLDTQAVIAYLTGDHANAHRDIRRALERTPDNFTMRYHLAMIEAALGEKARAITTLEQLVVQDGGEFPERAEAEQLLVKLKG
ncbi:MAG TPA: XrtA/PEP-CTERM system TPR-repeat protein PrsT [Halioglobus sp.]